MLSSTFIFCPEFQKQKGLVHGFTTRRGGNSRPPYDSLNLGWATGDDPDLVQSNYKAFAEAVGFPTEKIMGCRQVHEAGTYLITKDAQREQALDSHADALITQEASVLLSIKVADCLPILLLDAKTRAIAAVHAGWRSTRLKNVAKTIGKLQEKFGTKTSDVWVAIGPGIGLSKFEVGPGIGALFEKELEISGSLIRYVGEKAFLDLAGINAQLAQEVGVPPAQIWTSDLCTYSNESQFYSYRRDGKETGRMLGFIGWRS